MKARVEQMAQEHHRMLENIAEVEARIEAAHDQLDSAPYRTVLANG